MGRVILSVSELWTHHLFEEEMRDKHQHQPIQLSREQTTKQGCKVVINNFYK